MLSNPRDSEKNPEGANWYYWRRGRDSNSRSTYVNNGFRDRPVITTSVPLRKILYILLLLGLTMSADVVKHFLIYRLPVNRLTFGFKFFYHGLHHLALQGFLLSYALFSFSESAPIFVNSHFYISFLFARFPPFNSRPLLTVKLFLVDTMRLITVAFLTMARSVLIATGIVPERTTALAL